MAIRVSLTNRYDANSSSSAFASFRSRVSPRFAPAESISLGALECGMSARAALGRSVLPRIDKERDDGLFAKRLGGLQPVQTLDEYEARAVRSLLG